MGDNKDCSGVGAADGGAPEDGKPPGSVHAAVRRARGANLYDALSSRKDKGSPVLRAKDTGCTAFAAVHGENTTPVQRSTGVKGKLLRVAKMAPG